jgi:hypothetical protein
VRCGCIDWTLPDTTALAFRADAVDLADMGAAAPAADPAQRRAEAMHEAAHAVAAHALGCPVLHVTVAGHPFTRSDLSGASLTEHLVVLIAGDFGTALATGRLITPRYPEMLVSLGAARRGERGLCDTCQIAAALADAFGDAGDDQAAEVWLAHLALAEALIDATPIRFAIVALADTLMRDTTLNADAIVRILAPRGLRAAARRVLDGGLDLRRAA